MIDSASPQFIDCCSPLSGTAKCSNFDVPEAMHTRECGPSSLFASNRNEKSMSRPVISSFVPFSSAIWSSIAATFSSCGAESAGTFFLKIPAFSFAIEAKSLPRIFVWSRLIWVIAVTSGSTTFVESRRPPRPVSMTATSIAWSAKYLNAVAVRISKKDSVSLMSSSACAIILKSSVRSACVIISLLMQMRSRRSMRCGEVYCPTA